MRMIDADELLKHEIEADRMGAMLVVGKGYILSAPEVDAVPVVRGEWERMTNPYGDLEGFMCACGRTSQSADNYCPNCGAKMRGETE